MKHHPVRTLALAFLCLTALLSGCIASVPSHDANPLVSPYKAGGTLSSRLAPKTGDGSCPAPPAGPLRDLKYKGIYKQDDPHRAEIDEAAHQRYRQDTRLLRKFENELSSMANAYIVSGGRAQAKAVCVLDWLAAWADARALLGEDNVQGQFVRGWTLATMASSYNQIRNAAGLDPEKKVLVDAWLRDVAYRVKSGYPDVAELARQRNNHLYWASWAVTATGSAIGDYDLFDWGVRNARSVLRNQVKEDGTLPLEMIRGKKALQYHVFALTPLIMIMETAARNGDDLYAENNGAIHRLVERVVLGLEDSAWFHSETGKRQEPLDDISAEHFAWMEVYNARFPSAEIENWLDDRRPVIARRAGGDMTMLFRRRGR